MSTAPSSFDGVAEKFGEYEASVRGQVRYELTQGQLQPYLNNIETALDVCGGSGPDTAWLAKNGIPTVLIDPSREQLELARDRFETLTNLKEI